MIHNSSTSISELLEYLKVGKLRTSVLFIVLLLFVVYGFIILCCARVLLFCVVFCISETEIRRGGTSGSAGKWGNAPSSSEDELDKEAKQREADLKERDEYASRVREKDKDKTKKVMSKNEQKVHDIAN